jgi:hypothetical protein
MGISDLFLHDAGEELITRNLRTTPGSKVFITESDETMQTVWRTMETTILRGNEDAVHKN